MFNFTIPRLLTQSRYLCVKRKMSSSSKIVQEIFFKSVQAVQPTNLIRENVSVSGVSGRHLHVRGDNYELQRPCHIVGFGKAVLGMAVELEELLGPHLERGIVTVPEGIFENFPEAKDKSARIKFVEGAKDNIPDANALKGAEEIKKLVEGLTAEDLLFVLISGGGSALLPLPKPPITLEEKQLLIKELGRRGANIYELNTVRKQISVLKGNGLATLAHPARVVSLILSDVIGDPLDIIASGPTVANLQTADDALDIISKFIHLDEIPASIRTVLESHTSPESPKEEDRLGEQIPTVCSKAGPSKLGRNEEQEEGKKKESARLVSNYIIGNNLMAAEVSRRHAVSCGIQSAILSTEISGDVMRLSEIYAGLAHLIMKNNSTGVSQKLREYLEAISSELKMAPSSIEEVISLDPSRPILLVGAGEPTVVVKGRGRGGRNQQLALAFSVQLNNVEPYGAESADISFLSGGTDGIDGPTDAAGAIGTWDLVHNSLAENIRASDYLDNSDSYSFYSLFRGGEYLIKTGHTGTNVMDLHLLLISPNLD